ncbi:hypothetical protein EMCRGX_G016750 [Ephydatia muelleri]
MPHEAYRTSIHETTKATPFSLMFVQLPIDIMIGKPLGVTTTSTSEYARALTQQLVAPYEHGREHLGIEQRRHKQLYDRKGHFKKRHACWKGPYTVAKVYEKGVYGIFHRTSSRSPSGTVDDTLVRQTEPDMLQGVEHGTESQLVETGEATEEDPENLVPKMDDNMESEDEVQGTLEGPEEEGLRRSTWERKPAT